MRRAGFCLILLAAGAWRPAVALAWNDDSAVEQVEPASPVSDGNDPNASDDPLYVLEEEEEQARETQENERGIVRENGQGSAPRSVRASAPRTHVFINPSVRLAAKKAVLPRLSFEAFVSGGAGNFRENYLAFGTRAANVSGGMTATVDFDVVKAVLGYEHRQAYANAFQTWKSTGDKVGMTVAKTLPLFVPQLTLTPQAIATTESVSPANGSVSSLEATLGLTYKATSWLSLAVSAGPNMLFLYRLPNDRHDLVAKVSLGATIKPTEKLSLTLGANTTRTYFYGLINARADGLLSPTASIKYNFTPDLSVGLQASYGRYLSTIAGNRTFKYNLNPSLALTIPL